MEVGFAAFTKIIDKVGGIELELTESEASYLNSTNYIRNKKSRNVKVGMIMDVLGDSARRSTQSLTRLRSFR